MLIQNNGNWQFQNEATFEEILWENLQEWLGLTPLARQLGISGEYCDIVASDSGGRPIILELKNQEDRYIVQQLTRYYQNFLEERPNFIGINHTEPPRLIGIAPSLHRHNFIDRLYHRLSVELWTFTIQEQDGQFWLEFAVWHSSQEVKVFQKINITTYAASPKTLQVDPFSHLDKNWRIILAKRSETDQQKLLAIRDRILSFSPDLGEVVTLGKATYGQMRGKTTLCKSEERHCLSIEGLSTSKIPKIILYLPFFAKIALKTVRVRLIFEDWNQVQFLQFSQECNQRNLQMCNYFRYGGMQGYAHFHRKKNDHQLLTQCYVNFYYELIDMNDARFVDLCSSSQFEDILQKLEILDFQDLASGQSIYCNQSIHTLDDMIELALFDWQRRQNYLSKKTSNKSK